jgi:hypothetical protein
MVVDRIRWKGIYTVPNSLMDLQSCITLAHNSYLEATMQETPDKNMEMLANFIADCKAEIDKMNPPMPPPPPAPGPMAKPMPQPQSEMLPQGPPQQP